MHRLSITDADFEPAFSALLATARETTTRVDQQVATIIHNVREHGDQALIDLTARFDRTTLIPETLRISPVEIETAAASILPTLNDALTLAATRIEAFHRAQLPQDLHLTDDAGLTLGLRWTPLDSVGLYVPGGKAAYPSSVLMNAIPARVADVPRIAMCVPAPDNELNPLVLAAAHLAGVSEIYRIGGAQAVAALAYGTKTIAPVDRIVGPGNAYVAEAKRQVFGRVGIDSIAGPSEVVILAEPIVPPRHVALDLLAQAEHDEAAQAILITIDPAFADAVAAAVTSELTTLPRANIAGASWSTHGAIILVRDWSEAAALANRLAPEHLQLVLTNPDPAFRQIRHAGAVFLGPDTPEAIGDYVAGPNHVLPTGRTSRFASGLSVFDFLKRTTYAAAGHAALHRVGSAAIALAEAEGLTAHARSINVRLDPNSPGAHLPPGD
ncbi:MAG: histidinol dehydrogenase [Acetobacteraceae bacterium]|nr:histidinol dehydrogenase [Acetobacteraceae bacterium]